MLPFILLFIASFLAGIQNALAGGGSFLTFPALLMTGIDARAANITSTIALFPGQVATGFALRDQAEGVGALSFRQLLLISLLGGALGAVLLLVTPSSLFESMVPWLVLFATAVFAWGSFFRKGGPSAAHMGSGGAAVGQFLISIYGGYFGGGIGFLMLAVLTLAGMKVRAATATKMALAATMNASAVVILIFSPDVYWMQALVSGVAALAGGQVGAMAIKHVNERALRIGIVLLGVALTVGLFWRAGVFG